MVVIDVLFEALGVGAGRAGDLPGRAIRLNGKLRGGLAEFPPP
jgi:hypothetical protein